METVRSRAWRRSQRMRVIYARSKLDIGHGTTPSPGYFAKQHGQPSFVRWWAWGREKKWSLLYLRSRKLARARQLGLPYPRRSWSVVTHGEHGDATREPLRVLFVCSKNRWRSPTAEHIWRRDPRVAVRSAGTCSTAVHTLTLEDIVWADLVLVMEDKHEQRVRSLFTQSGLPRIVILGIPDDYRFLSPDLVDLMRRAVEPILAEGLAPS